MKRTTCLIISLKLKVCLIVTSLSSLMQTLMLNKHLEEPRPIFVQLSLSLRNLMLLKCIITTKLILWQSYTALNNYKGSKLLNSNIK